nr:uncharacterized protein LOC129267231 [Lytechinus pictus]
MHLDKELREEAENEMEKLLAEHDERRAMLSRQMSENLQAKLDQATTKEEIEKIMSDHEKKMADSLDQLDKQKANQMQALMRRLANRRREKEGALKRQHKAEAEQLGIKLEDAGETDPEGVLQSQGLDLDLLMAEENASRTKDQANISRNLAKEQQKMMSDNMNNTLTNLEESGVLSESDVSDLKGELESMEDQLNRKMAKRKSDLNRNMKNKMAEKRRRKTKKLQTQHDKELEKCTSSEEAEEVEERHQKRMEAMEKWLDSEENQLAQSIEKEIGNQHAKELQEGHKEILDKLADSHGVDQVTQQRLLDQLRRNKRRHLPTNSASSLAARRGRRKQDMHRLAEEEAAQRILKEQEKAVGKKDDGGGSA